MNNRFLVQSSSNWSCIIHLRALFVISICLIWIIVIYSPLTVSHHGQFKLSIGSLIMSGHGNSATASSRLSPGAENILRLWERPPLSTNQRPRMWRGRQSLPITGTGRSIMPITVKSLIARMEPFMLAPESHITFFRSYDFLWWWEFCKCCLSEEIPIQFLWILFKSNQRTDADAITTRLNTV